MKLITHPNCLLASAAMVMETSSQKIIDYLGHDGSEIVFPDLEPPGNQRGFSFQEIIDFAYLEGYNVFPIHGAPCVSPDGKDVYSITKWKHFKGNGERFAFYLKYHKGIIIGQKDKYDHAVAWKPPKIEKGKFKGEGYIFDPTGEMYLLEKCTLKIKTFWVFIKLN